jgi:short-subunit dehydrogenase
MPIEKIILITGATHGIGFAATKYLAEEGGYRIYAGCRDHHAEALLKLSESSRNVRVLPLDVTSDSSVKDAVAEILKCEKTIDVVINNAGFGIYGPSEIHTIEEIQKIFNTNFVGVIRVNNEVIPIMRKQRKGRIINIGSISGCVPSKNMAIYSAIKAALETLTAADAYALKPFGIKCSLIIPGPVVTNFERRTAFGSRFKLADNPYGDNLVDNREKWKKMMEDGQSPLDVARTIQEAMEMHEPKLWYPTSLRVEEHIKRQFTDPTGNRRIPTA